MKQKRVFLMSGAPGCGKSTWINKQIAQDGGVHVSRDAVRFAQVKEGEQYFAHENDVFKKFVEMANTAIADENGPDNIYVDATHLNANSRAKIMHQLHLDNAKVTVVSFKVPLETCLERNEQRTAMAYVPKSAVRRMWYQQTDPKDDLSLTYDNIMYVEE